MRAVGGIAFRGGRPGESSFYLPSDCRLVLRVEKPISAAC
jgi:hypothetical protein